MILTNKRANILISVTLSSAFSRAKTEGFLHNSRSVGNSSSCMGFLLFDRTYTSFVLPLEKNISDFAGMHQVRYHTEHTRRCWRYDAAQIGPHRREHGCAAVW